MARMPAAIALVVCCASGCAAPPRPSIAVSYSSPVDAEIPVDADELAAFLAAHRAGWDECLDRFLYPELRNVAQSHLVEEPRLDPADRSARPAPRDEPPPASQARAAGFEQCRLTLLELSEAHGEDNVRFALDTRRRE